LTIFTQGITASATAPTALAVTFTPVARAATSVDDIQYAGNVLALAFLFGGRRHGKFEQYHGFLPFLK
jgi:hypothetical protein